MRKQTSSQNVIVMKMLTELSQDSLASVLGGDDSAEDNPDETNNARAQVVIFG